MPRKRSLPSADTLLSCSSTESSLSGSFVESLRTAQEGWMYWKRDEGCWMKVFVLLRRHVLWLTRSAAPSALASPLIQVAIADVDRMTDRAFRVTGPSGETMELHLYDGDDGWAWLDALESAARQTQTRLSQQPTPLRPSRSLRRLAQRTMTTLDEHEYRGTLVVYEEDRKGSRWRRFWHALGWKQSLRRRLESVVDRLESSQERPTE
ncbi:hypothetical protein ATCC90586_001607 [Pythium insidiosum]|nr:hypothetical protein ATCC90586_001607 [Pythium insidiosum]